MTAVLDKPQKPKSQELWASMPGWGITVNLLPPEVLASRRVRTLRKVTAIVLGVVVVLTIAAYAWEFWQTRQAGAQLASAQATTAQLDSQQAKYAPVVALQTEIAHVRQELQTVRVGDVDLAPLVEHILRISPNPNGVTKVEVDVAAASAQSGTGTTSQASDSGMLDTSGRTHIGDITITGTVRTVNDVATYVNRLATIPGIVEVIPTSQQIGTAGMDYSITMTMTDQLLATAPPAATTLTTTGG